MNERISLNVKSLWPTHFEAQFYFAQRK